MKKNYKKDYKFVAQFLDCDGMSGNEHQVAELYKRLAKESGAEVTRGGLGSVIAKMGNKGPKVMISAHMDEVGFVVSRIEKNGFLRISPVGGSWGHIILGLPVKVINTKGDVFHGTIGSTSIHVVNAQEATKVVKMKDMFVDIGIDTQKEINNLGIDVGDLIIRESKTRLIGNGDKFMGKAADNRYGLAIAAKVLERLKGKQLKCQLYMVGSSQEEVGLRGAKASVRGINPDVAIGLDTTVSHDTPGVIPGNTALGKGVSVTMKDGGTLPNRVFANMLFDLAKENKIDVHKFVSQGGGNDTAELQFGRAGIPAVSLGIATRYLHTVNEIGSLKDFNDYVDLLVKFILLFDNKKYQSMLYK